MNEHNLNITFTSLFRIVLVGVICYLAYLLSNLILILVTAIIIAYAIKPVKDTLVSRMKFPTIVAVPFLYLLFMFILGSLIYGVFPIIAEQTEGFFDSLPAVFASIEASLPTGFASDIFSNIFAFINTLNYQLIISKLPGTGISIISGLTSAIAYFTLLFLFAIYFSFEDENIKSFVKSLVPLKYENYTNGLMERTGVKIGLWFKGQLLLGLIAGVFVFLILSLLGVENVLFLAVLAAVAEIIPIFGPMLATIPALLLAFVSGGIGLVLLVLVAYIAIQQLQANLVYPLVVTKVVGLPVPLILVSLFAGFTLFGFIGALIAIPIASFMQEIYSDIRSGVLKKL